MRKTINDIEYVFLCCIRESNTGYGLSFLHIIYLQIVSYVATQTTFNFIILVLLQYIMMKFHFVAVVFSLLYN